MKRIQLLQGHITLFLVLTVEDRNALYLGCVENEFMNLFKKIFFNSMNIFKNSYKSMCINVFIN